MRAYWNTKSPSKAYNTEIRVEQEGGNFFLVSSYMAHNRDVSSVPLVKLTEENRGEDILLRFDAACVILNSNLSICNRELSPLSFSKIRKLFWVWRKSWISRYQQKQIAWSSITGGYQRNHLYRITPGYSSVFARNPISNIQIREKSNTDLQYRNPKKRVWINLPT